MKAQQYIDKEMEDTQFSLSWKRWIEVLFSDGYIDHYKYKEKERE